MTGSDFWSRRMASVKAEARDEERKATLEAEEQRERALEEKTDDEILRELNLPPPETLEAGDDFKAFLSAAVPQRLKRAALRRLWAVNPVLANLDGLVEYGEDYTDAATVLETLTTTYQVGKGMTAHVEEMIRQAEAETEEQTPKGDPETVAAHVEADPDETDLERDEEEQTSVSDEPDPVELAAEADETNFYAKPKRMRYSFE